MIYTVTFNPAIDHAVRMEKLEIGSVNRSRADARNAHVVGSFREFEERRNHFIS